MVITYKGMSQDMRADDFDIPYKIGESYSIANFTIALNGKGFVGYANPLNVLMGFPPPDARYFVVEQFGEIITDGIKTVSSKIDILEEVDLDLIIRDARNYLVEILGK